MVYNLNTNLKVQDLLLINADYLYSKENQNMVVATEDASTLINSPIMYAYREVLPIISRIDKYKFIIRLTENYPFSGRVCTNTYNSNRADNKWIGWDVYDSC